MTTLNEAKQAVNDRFKTLWGTKTTYSLPNEPFTQPTPDESWVRLTVLNVGGGQESLGKVGNRRFERRGIIIVNVFTPLEEGTFGGDTLASEVQTIYEGTKFDGITVNDSRIREKGVEDQWYHTIMEADFIYYEIK